MTWDGAAFDRWLTTDPENQPDMPDEYEDYCGCCGGRSWEAPKGLHGVCCIKQHDLAPE